MADTLRARIAKALYEECLQQDAWVDKAHGKYVPDPTDPADWITVDGRIAFTELADAVIRELKLERETAEVGTHETIERFDVRATRYVTEWAADD